MWHNTSGDETIIRYLLGQLPAEERDSFEDRYFSNDQLHAELLAIEEELIDRYVNGGLASQDKVCFEMRLPGSPELRQKVLFATALAAVIRQPGDRTTPFLAIQRRSKWEAALSRWRPHSLGMRVALAVAAIAICIGLVAMQRLWQHENRIVPSPVTSADHRQQTLVSAKDENPLVAAKAAPPLAPLLAFTLVPGNRGGEEGTILSIPAGIQRIRLDLSLEPAGFVRYAAVIKSANDKEVWRKSNLRLTSSRALGNSVSITVPSPLLPAGDFTVKLSGLTPERNTELIAGYSFQVRRTPAAGKSPQP